ncbi:MAG: Trm112 family protein [Candidatus Nezhaarchaeota archaeon]|nr:Trm112 family protein [Candidatus Nezhaarchaeota archaeon]
MKLRLMDLLACPMCKKFPLKLLIFKIEERDRPKELPSKCPLYCAFKSGWVKDVKPTDDECLDCFSKEVVEGLIICDGCYRWYPIIDEIPHMLPDDLRLMDPDEELEFMRKWINKFPEEIAKSGKPFNEESLREERIKKGRRRGQ